jgi:hypothetical protein
MRTQEGSMTQGYETIHLSDIPEPEYEPEPGDPYWRPIRIHFGIQAFGTNAYVARAAGDQIIVEHAEAEESGTRHEELYVVVSGHATFTVDGEDVDAPAGTLLYVSDPGSRRGAVAHEAGTTVLCFGGTPGEAFSVSPWEQKYEAGAS